MENDSLTLDPQRQEQAKEYARIKRRLMVVDWAFAAFYLVLWLAFGWSIALRDWIFGYTQYTWLRIVLFAAIFGGIYTLLGLPLSFYASFTLPHRYGLSNQTHRDWWIDRFKGLLIGAPIGLLVLEIIYLILRAYPDTWWLLAAGFFLVFDVLLTTLAPILLFPIFYKFVPLGEEHADLETRLLALAEQAGTRVKGVYKFDMSRRTKAANAALTGSGASRRIILGDTLIDEFTPDEIETVLAHELAHHVHNDIPLGILFSSAVTLLGLWLSAFILEQGVASFDFQGVSDIAALPLFGLVMGAYGLLTMPLTNAWSRWRERMADRYALQSTAKGPAFASAFTRLANQNLADVDPEPWVEWLLYSHPALSKRIKMAEESDT